jgi:hypothetical protein
MKKIIVLVAAWLLFAGPVLAACICSSVQAQTIGSLPTASSVSLSNQFAVWQGGTTRSATLSQVAAEFGVLPIYLATSNGLRCDDTTDDTAALNALLTTVNTAGGGVIMLPSMCLINGQITLPNSATGSPTQSYIRITGTGYNSNNTGVPVTAPSGLDLRSNSAGGKIVSLGAGVLEIDHLNLQDGGADCAPFLFVTNTIPVIHNVAFVGTASARLACNDAIIAGGTGTSIGGSLTAPYQGYAGFIQDNYFSKIRRAVFFQSFANNLFVHHNDVSITSGSNLTASVSAATNASSTALTVTGHGFAIGVPINLVFIGGTGNWAALNGSQTATPTDANTLTVAVNTTSFGGLTGSLAYYNGAAFDVDGATGEAVGNDISDNLIEVTNYAFAFRLNNAAKNNFLNNGIWDATIFSITSNYLILNTGAAFDGVVLDAEGSGCLTGAVGCGIPEFTGVGAVNWLSLNAISTATLNHDFGQNTINTALLQVGVLPTDTNNAANIKVKEGPSCSSGPFAAVNSSNAIVYSIGCGGLITTTGGVTLGAAQALQWSPGSGANLVYSPSGSNLTLYGQGVLGLTLNGITTTSNLPFAAPGITSTTNVVGNYLRATATTVSGLATADPSPVNGDKAYVTDATACTFGSAVTGSGSNHCPVFYNGSAWVAG